MKAFLFFLFTSFFLAGHAQEETTTGLVKKVKARLDGINDYQATGNMKIDVSFMKIPESKVTVYFKKPNRFKIKKQDGISIVPKGGMNINLGSLFSGDNYTSVPAGKGNISGTPVTIVKLLPLDEQSDVVVSTLYIDEKAYLVRRAVITTRENGTYEMEMSYGQYASRGLPDKVVFTFATKDYKLPKGLAFDYDTGDKPKSSSGAGDQKGKVEITYTGYTINKGLDDAVFH